ncbi:protein translocase subunit [Pestalotiopsis sp. IQ-011]
MSKPASRLLATTIRQTSPWQGSIHLPIRSFSQTCRRFADESGPSDPPSPAAPAPQTQAAPRRPAQPSSFSSLSDLSASLGGARPAQSGEQLAQDAIARARNQPTAQDTLMASSEDLIDKENWARFEEPFHFHVYAHKHNTHITVTKPDRNAIVSVSTGNIGFKKSKRGTYDAAYQLAAYVIDKLNQGNWHKKIHKLEVVLRGFGNGREAGTKVLLGSEGKFLRPKIVAVSDSTRLKFGGTRSRKPRRLG